MSTKSCAKALEWWLRNKDKLDGSSVCTQEIKEDSGEFIILIWKVDGIDQPSDDQINQIISDYASYLTKQVAIDAQRRTDLLAKLGLSEDDLGFLLNGK